jgi:hypothetical protein
MLVGIADALLGMAAATCGEGCSVVVVILMIVSATVIVPRACAPAASGSNHQ